MTDRQILTAYRHDEHKTRGGSHSAGRTELAGKMVNEDVPYGADGDAAAMSRPNGKPEQTIPGHDTHYRISLITGETEYDEQEFNLQQFEDRLIEIYTTDDGEKLHKTWLNSDVMGAFNESVYYPYTSHKYHTLLVVALVDNYRDGNTFDDLSLSVTDDVVPHRTVFSGEFNLTIQPDGGGAKIADSPWRNWDSVWQRLSEHPGVLDVAENRFDMTLDTQLRRIRAWSTALQYIEDYQQWRRQYE